jgi:hypothetical protein
MSQSIIETGGTAAVTGFYSQNPVFIILAAVLGLVGDTNAPQAMGVYPLILGLVFPVTGFLVGRRIVPNDNRAGLAAALIAGVAKMSVNLSYLPIAQSLGVAIWCILLIAVLGYLINRSRRYVLIILITFITLIFTHKLPPSVIVGIFLMYSIILLAVHIPTDNIVSRSNTAPINPNGLLVEFSVISAILAILLALQYFYLTSLGLQMINKLGFILTASFEAPLYSNPPQSPVAVNIRNNLQSTILWRLHGFVMLPIGGCIWFWLLNSTNKQHNIFILVSMAISVGFMIVSLIEPSVGSLGRHLFFAEPLLAGIIAGGALGMIHSHKTNQIVGLRQFAVVIVSVVILAQVVSLAVALPDNPEYPRVYLDSDENAAKAFSSEHSLNISSDLYYSHETPPMLIRNRISRLVDPFAPSFLLSADFNSISTEYIILRPDVRVVRTSYGSYRLMWKPSEIASQKYDKIYSNPSAEIYGR